MSRNLNFPNTLNQLGSRPCQVGNQNIWIWLLSLDDLVHLAVETLLGVVGQTSYFVVIVP